jgi:cytochrome c peroxidase
MSPGKLAACWRMAGVVAGMMFVLGSPAFAQSSSTTGSNNATCLRPGGVLDIACTLPGSANEDPDVRRVNKEIDTIEAGTLVYVYSHSLDVSHQMQYLGELEVFDKKLSVNNNVACASCHDPETGFKNGVSVFNQYVAGASPGSVPITTGHQPDYRIAKRSPQTYSYATFAPVLQFNPAQQTFYGGNFWDMRATGARLQSPSAEQSQDPPLDPDEMANPDPACIVWKISIGSYKSFFEQLWGVGTLEFNWPSNVSQICSTPKGAAIFGNNATPLALSAVDRARANAAYNDYALAVAAYEASPQVSSFTSKFDYYLSDPAKYPLTAQELQGYQLFRGKAGCNQCHLDGTGTGEGMPQAANLAPVFADFTPNNIGLPKDNQSEWYLESTPDEWGYTPNPMGYNFTDTGMGLFLSGFYGTGSVPNTSWISQTKNVSGLFQTPTLRNVDMRPYPSFVKAYMHNGYLKSLKEVVHFYNTSQALPRCAEGSKGEKVTCWPQPEYPLTLNTTQLGNLHLSDEEENDVVLFLQTLTDGYKP